jgi:hypothetical protein
MSCDGGLRCRRLGTAGAPPRGNKSGNKLSKTQRTQRQKTQQTQALSTEQHPIPPAGGRAVASSNPVSPIRKSLQIGWFWGIWLSSQFWGLGSNLGSKVRSTLDVGCGDRVVAGSKFGILDRASSAEPSVSVWGRTVPLDPRRVTRLAEWRGGGLSLRMTVSRIARVRCLTKVPNHRTSGDADALLRAPEIQDEPQSSCPQRVLAFYGYHNPGDEGPWRTAHCLISMLRAI